MKTLPPMSFCPPVIQARMTGAIWCKRDLHQTELTYEDGSTEIVNTGDLPATIDWQDWFSIVAGIQSLRERNN